MQRQWKPGCIADASTQHLPEQPREGSNPPPKEDHEKEGKAADLLPSAPAAIQEGDLIDLDWEEATPGTEGWGEVQPAAAGRKRKDRGDLDFLTGNEELKANVGHGAQAQDLCMQRMTELGAGLAVVTEPFWIPVRSANWFGGPNGSVALVANSRLGVPPCTFRESGPSYVAVDWGPVTVVGIYLPHHRNRAGLGRSTTIKAVLDRVGELVRRCHPRPVIVAGDFNAHSEGLQFPATGPPGGHRDWLGGGTGPHSNE
ncbi:uncharacterized protein LOC112590427 [Harpegnathos saltator]|uniref:uncharacterized protein LOC112590427 n=1 Tax=Harpegnathos saltator TaxID=610380 RepID=UPI000DBED30B|nr:uncharacterized protein LOC112590427 [Harpegnathos saltator]